MVLRNWSDAFFSTYSIDAVLDVQRLDTSHDRAFQSHIQGECRPMLRPHIFRRVHDNRLSNLSGVPQSNLQVVYIVPFFAVSDAFTNYNVTVVVPDKCSTLLFLSGTASASPDPVFTLAPFSCMKETLVNVHGFPSQFSLSTAAIRDVLLELQWQNVIMFFDDTFGKKSLKSYTNSGKEEQTLILVPPVSTHYGKGAKTMTNDEDKSQQDTSMLRQIPRTYKQLE